jgi:hypothetical protein
MATFTPGVYSTDVTNNFLSFYDALKPNIEELLVQRYGKELLGLSMMMDLFGATKGTDNLQYSHYEMNRVMPKISATSPGGAAGAAVTFTLATDSKTAYGSYVPYNTSSTVTTKALPVRVNDILQVKPASGTTVSSGNYIQCIVLSVDKSAGTFSARPVDSTKSIPTIATADEIAIMGNANGEKSTDPESLTYGTEKYTNNLGIIRHLWEVSDIGNDVKTWYNDGPLRGRFSIRGEQVGFTQFMNMVDLRILTSENINNLSVSEAFDTLGQPIAATKGLIPELTSRANNRTYAGAVGFTVSDMEDLVIELDAQKAGDDHLFFTGIALGGQIDREFRDLFKNGAISYGSFTGDSEKSVNLAFQNFSINGYTFHKRNLAALNDTQTTGAAGYGYKYEGFTIPTRSAKIAGGEEMGAMVPTLRKRYLQSATGESREYRIEYFDGFKSAADGEATHKVRYIAHCGFELFAANTCSYIKRA